MVYNVRMYKKYMFVIGTFIKIDSYTYISIYIYIYVYIYIYIYFCCDEQTHLGCTSNKFFIIFGNSASSCLPRVFTRCFHFGRSWEEGLEMYGEAA